MRREDQLWLRFAHEDWKRVVQSDEFHDWLHTQPESVVVLAESERAVDAIAVISAFKLDTNPNITGVLPAPGVLH